MLHMAFRVFTTHTLTNTKCMISELTSSFSGNFLVVLFVRTIMCRGNSEECDYHNVHCFYKANGHHSITLCFDSECATVNIAINNHSHIIILLCFS